MRVRSPILVMTTEIRRRGGTLGCIAILALATACGTDGAGPEAQPSRDSASFVQGAFAELPRYPGGAPAGERSDEDDAVTQSFEVSNASPEMIVDFFADQLQGWTMIGQIEKIGVDTFRGHWTRDQLDLTVSATSAPSLSGTSQYSLSLRSG